MKGFIFSLTQLESLPGRIIFYNSGAKLCLKDSPVLDDLKMLEQMSVEITACGTCLDYFNATEQLAVGKITNIYDVTRAMQSAAAVLRP